MPGKIRDPDGEALWQRVAETVRPLKGRLAVSTRGAVPVVPADPGAPIAARPPVVAFAARSTTASKAKGVAIDTLDGGWDRRLRRGIVAPDLTIDLHGYTVAAAHTQLEASLSRAVAMHFRLLLIVTGRAPRPDTERRDGRPVRGAIRASIGDWLAQSRYAGHVAAVRNAHPKHGGAGAIYVILRRTRE